MAQERPGLGCWSIVGLVGLVAVVGGVGTYLYFRGLGKSFTFERAAQVIPSQAIATSHINTDAAAWEELGQFGTPEAQKYLTQGLDNLNQQLSQESLNYEDLQPWVGGITFAFLPSAENSNQKLLLVIGVKDQLEALAFQEKLTKDPKIKTNKTQYKNIEITEVAQGNRSPYFFALVGDHLLLSDQITVVQQGIDTYQGGDSYQEKPGVRDLISRYPKLEKPLIQFYVDDYGGFLEKTGLSSQLPPETSQQVQSVVGGVGVETEGLHLQATAKLKSPDNLPQSEKVAGAILEQIPGNTLMLASGGNVKEIWLNLLKSAEKDQTSQNLVREIREGLRELSLDADTEVFNWMDGEMDLAVVETPVSGTNPVGMGGMLLWQTSDRPTAQKSFDKLAQLAQSQGGLSLSQTQIDGQTIGQLTANSEALVSYGMLKEDYMAITIALPFQTLSQVEANNSLTQEPNFQSLLTVLPSDNFGYFYLNLEKAMPLILSWSERYGSYVPPETKAIGNSLKALGMTTTQPEPDLTQLDGFLTLVRQNSEP